MDQNSQGSGKRKKGIGRSFMKFGEKKMSAMSGYVKEKDIYGHPITLNY